MEGDEWHIIKVFLALCKVAILVAQHSQHQEVGQFGHTDIQRRFFKENF
jgi:hypothetical protein